MFNVKIRVTSVVFFCDIFRPHFACIGMISYNLWPFLTGSSGYFILAARWCM